MRNELVEKMMEMVHEEVQVQYHSLVITEKYSPDNQVITRQQARWATIMRLERELNKMIDSYEREQLEDMETTKFIDGLREALPEEFILEDSPEETEQEKAVREKQERLEIELRKLEVQALEKKYSV